MTAEEYEEVIVDLKSRLQSRDKQIQILERLVCSITDQMNEQIQSITRAWEKDCADWYARYNKLLEKRR
jgi:hypothetical protein